jgi:hypothetical protein
MNIPTARSIIRCFTLAPLKLASANNQLQHARPMKGLMHNAHSVFIVDALPIIAGNADYVVGPAKFTATSNPAIHSGFCAPAWP